MTGPEIRQMGQDPLSALSCNWLPKHIATMTFAKDWDSAAASKASKPAGSQHGNTKTKMDTKVQSEDETHTHPTLPTEQLAPSTA